MYRIGTKKVRFLYGFFIGMMGFAVMFTNIYKIFEKSAF